jgi:hypothetical protein
MPAIAPGARPEEGVEVGDVLEVIEVLLVEAGNWELVDEIVLDGIEAVAETETVAEEAEGVGDGDGF